MWVETVSSGIHCAVGQMGLGVGVYARVRLPVSYSAENTQPCLVECEGGAFPLPSVFWGNGVGFLGYNWQECPWPHCCTKESVCVYTWTVAATLSLKTQESIIFNSDLGRTSSFMLMMPNKPFSFFVFWKCMRFDFSLLKRDNSHRNKQTARKT